MKKQRVYELAKELKTDTGTLMAKLAEIGIQVKSHASTLSEEDVERARKEMFDPNAKEVVEKRLKPTLIRRRVKKDKPKPAKEDVPGKKAAKEKEAPGGETKPAKTAREQTPEAQFEPKTQAKKEQPTKGAQAPQVRKLSKAEQEILAEKLKKLKKIEERDKARRLPQRAYTKPAILKKTKGELPVSEPSKPAKKGAETVSTDEEIKNKGKKKGKTEVTDQSGAKKPVRKTTGRRKEFVTKKDLMDGGDRIFRVPRKKKKVLNRKSFGKTEITTPKAIKRVLKIADTITVSELSKRMGVKASDVMRKLMALGIMATINQSIGLDEATLVAHEYEYEVENVAVEESDFFLGQEEEEEAEEMLPRPPVVTIMGHVDHGKTSLLDAIRETKVAESEKGGITQHIGAYSVELPNGKITFLDTPGHEAFTAMRARGAKATDIVVLVVAAEDGVMPQTVEAIDHAKAAKVPIVVAINKIDKPEADPEAVKRSLADLGLQPEEWGGDVLFTLVSAKQKTGIKELLEAILLQAEVLELKTNHDKIASGVVVEAKMERGRGPVATLLVMEGTLTVGSTVVSGNVYGNARALVDDVGNKIQSAGPSTPVELLGLSSLPQAGDSFNVVKEERVARQVTQHRLDKAKMEATARSSPAKASLEDLYARLEEGQAKELKVIIKADVQGSSEALADSLTKLSTDRCKLKVIHSAPGGINENDVNLAIASKAVIIGFNIKAEAGATRLAERENIEIRQFAVIYDALDEVRKAMEGLLEPTLVTKQLGTAEVRDTFHISKVGVIAGCLVTQGKVMRSSQVRLVRDNQIIFDGKIANLKRFKDDVKEVPQGAECGIRIENFNDIKAGDLIEAFMVEEMPTAL